MLLQAASPASYLAGSSESSKAKSSPAAAGCVPGMRLPAGVLLTVYTYNQQKVWEAIRVSCLLCSCCWQLQHHIVVADYAGSSASIKWLLLHVC